VSAVVVVAALLLVGAGAAKASRPHGTARAARVPAGVVRAGAIVELALGVATLATGLAPLCWAVSVSYLAFAVWVAAARRRGAPLWTCGCFGEVDTPPTMLHVLVDLGLGAGAAASAAAGGATVTFSLLLVGAVTAYVCYLALAELPRTLSAGRP
jgi:hypothetical protein